MTEDDGELRIRSQMKEVLPEGMRRSVTSYMKQYAEASGWRLKISFKKNYVELVASRASSRASKNEKSFL